MPVNKLIISVGQYSDKGRKKINQDFHGICIPKEPQLTTKGIAIALADGISSSDVGHIASEATVFGFLEDYYCTSEAWSVKKSAHQVLAATNSWLYSQTQQGQYRFNKDKGYVCTLSAMIIKSTMVHIFHLGDARIYRLNDSGLEQLTNDHRLWVSQDKSYLSRAMGINPHLDIDYQSIQVNPGDVFVLTTDGVYEFVDTKFMIDAMLDSANDLNATAKIISEKAYQNGSKDNLTVQIIRIDQLPSQNVDEIYQQLTTLPFPPILEPRMVFDGYRILRKLHSSCRSHVYLAIDDKDKQVVIKTPSIDLQNDPAYLERFLMEEWIARRINSAHVLKAFVQTKQRHYIYTITEYIDGQTLSQWMRDNPKPKLETIRGIIEQIAKGLRAFHRLEMLHQDLRPDNIMIDPHGTVKIIDFGSTKVAGVAEISTALQQQNNLGTAQYTSPENLLGDIGTPRSDLYSLGVISYQMLTGNLPYGAKIARAKTKTEQKKLNYKAISLIDHKIPIWIDNAIKKAVHPDPLKRYQDLSEFIYDLRHPNKDFLNNPPPPLLERDPLVFWKNIALIQTIIIIALLIK